MKVLIVLGCLCITSSHCLDSKFLSSFYRSNSDSLASRYSVQLSELTRKPKVPLGFVPVLNSPPADETHDKIELRAPKSLDFKTFVKNLDALKAAEHFLEMEEKTACSLPSPRVICVQDHYPDADIIYKPACTILHRCTSESGCCKNPKKTCQPSTTEKVTLYFQDSSNESASLKLAFTNHTSCNCGFTGEVEDSEPADGEPQPDSNGVDEDEEIFEDDIVNSCPSCPRPFSKRFARGMCQCDCFEDDLVCLKVKSGQQALDPKDRRCVRQKLCNQPTCELGSHYNEDFGECRKPTYEQIVETNEDQTDQAESGEVTKHRRVRHRRKQSRRTFRQ